MSTLHSDAILETVASFGSCLFIDLNHPLTSALHQRAMLETVASFPMTF